MEKNYIRIRAFNKEGLVEWKRRYEMAKDEKRNTFDLDFLQDPKYTHELGLEIDMERKNFRTRLAFIKYIAETLQIRNNRHLYYNKSFWIWLTSYYFDTITPRKRNGILKVKAIQWYYAGDPGGTGRLNRGAIDFPCKIYDNSPEFAVVALTGAPHESSDLCDRLGDQRSFMLNRALITVLHRLFHNTNELVRKKVRRFFQVLKQISMTRDIERFSADEIMELLSEVSRDLVEHLEDVEAVEAVD